MNEEKSSQKEQFLRETERQLRMAQVEATLEADNLIHALWNGKPLCTVDTNGTVRFSPADIRGADDDTGSFRRSRRSSPRSKSTCGSWSVRRRSRQSI